jgi:hypothetical protein
VGSYSKDNGRIALISGDGGTIEGDATPKAITLKVYLSAGEISSLESYHNYPALGMVEYGNTFLSDVFGVRPFLLELTR